MSESNNATHVIRKRGSNVLYPYSEELAGKPGFSLLTIAEAYEQGLLDKRRHAKGPNPEIAELAAKVKDLTAQNAIMAARLKHQAEVAKGVKAAPEPEVAVGRGPVEPEPEIVAEPEVVEADETPLDAEEAGELSSLLAELDDNADSVAAK